MRDGDLLAMAVCGGNAGATCTRTAATCRCCLQICIELLAGLRASARRVARLHNSVDAAVLARSEGTSNERPAASSILLARS